MFKTCLLDMDGVLADFVTGVQQMRGEPFHPVGEWAFVQSREWQHMDQDFWRTLPVLPYAAEIVATCMDKFGDSRVAVVSSPTRTAGCIRGKRDWLARHFPELLSRAFFGSRKETFASPHTHLVDDYDENVRLFREAGGSATLIPASYNSAWGGSFPGVLAAIRALA